VAQGKGERDNVFTDTTSDTTARLQSGVRNNLRAARPRARRFSLSLYVCIRARARACVCVYTQDVCVRDMYTCRLMSS